MSNREQQILRLGAWFACEFDGPVDQYAREVYDLILPEVTTVEQLEALPIGTVVVDVKDRPWLRLSSEWWDHCGMVKPTHWLMLHPGSVTVVWQPKATR